MPVEVGTVFLASYLCFSSRLRFGDPFLGPLILNGNSYCTVSFSCVILCFLLLSNDMHICWNSLHLKKKILHLISHLPPDTAPFSAPLSVKLLKELLIVSFTSFPFPPHHSTETILVSVISGPVVTISSGQYSALFLIDPSAALDTICHFFPLP